MSQWSITEYRCSECGVFEALVQRPAPDVQACPECNTPAPWTISAPHPKVASVPCYAAVRGGDSDRRPNQLDTRPIAEGQSIEAWRKAQEPARHERRYQELLAKGLLKPRIQVG